MTKRMGLEDSKQNEDLAGYFKESEWTRKDKLKNLAVNILALIGSLILLAIPLLGFARFLGDF